MSFDQFDLAPPLLASIEAVGYTTPTPIQQQAIPLALQGQDVLGLAQTGTGKTAAFILPILQRLMNTPTQRRVRALVVAPTRELAEQIHQVAADLGKNTKVRSVTVYGGVSKGPQLAGLRRGAEIVIACPGRLLDHINEGAISLSNVEVLVLDEADTMCNMGFLPDIRRILGHLPTQRQTLFFSATMPPDIRKLSMEILDSPTVVEVDRSAPAKTVSHALYPVPDSLKKQLLLAMLEQTPTGRALIFTRTKHRARTLARDLEKSKYRVSALQGNLSQNRRQEAMDGFRDGKYDLMVATDIAAHGIDVPEVSHVINFDMPDTVDAYTHRIGRTGRALQTGEAFTIAVAADAPMVRDVERALDAKIERRRLPDFDYGGFMPESQFPEGRQVQAKQPAQTRARPRQPQTNRSGGQRSNRAASPRPNALQSPGPTSGERMGLGAGAARPSGNGPNTGTGPGEAGASRGASNDAAPAPRTGPGTGAARTPRGPGTGATTGPGTGAARPSRSKSSGAATGTGAARPPRGPNSSPRTGPGTGAARPSTGVGAGGRLGTRPGSSNGAARPPAKRRAGPVNNGQQLGRRSEERSGHQTGTQLGKKSAPKPAQRASSGPPRGGRPATNR